jgi:hypothetical protein
MRPLTKVSLSFLLTLSLAASLFAAAKKEYFTDDELDLIRDAQELGMRVQTYFKLAERRLIFLGVMEKSKEQIEKERKDKDKRAKEQKKSVDTRASADKAPIEDTSYLDAFRRLNPSRLYSGAGRSDTGDAYSRKLDVRDSLEDLAKFIKDTVPLLEKSRHRMPTSAQPCRSLR